MNIITKIIWSVSIAMIFINSIYYSLKLKFPQIKFKKIFSSLKEKDEGNITSKDSLFLSLASKLGSGSLAGIAFAIFYGGIGTIFWMWMSSFFTSINCFLENILSTIYKEKDGINCKGGPSYYIKNGLHKKILGSIYAILAIGGYIFGFLTVQNNTITTLVKDMYNIKPLITSLIITFLAGFLIIKGLKQISKLCNKIIPLMTSLYLILGIIVILLNIKQIPIIIINIIKEAFTIKSTTGGIIYTFIIGMQKTIFSNEAGVGTSAIASGSNNNKNYLKQGFIGIVETYFISLFITTITAFLIILSNYKSLNLTNINGIELTKYAFNFHFGHIGEILLLIILLLFSFSTIVTCYYYGESNLKMLTNNKIIINILKIVTIMTLFFGGIIPSNFAWFMGDALIGLMAIINIYAIYKLKHVILKKVKI